MTDLNKYAKAALAEKMYRNREDDKFVKGALDDFAQDVGFSDEAKGFIEGAYMSRAGLQKATEVYGELQRQEAIGLKGQDFVEWYSQDGENVFEGLSEADKNTFVSKLTEHGDETFGDISKAYRKASIKLNSPEGDYSDEEIAEARETIDKYKHFMTAYEELTDFKLESKRSSTLPFARKRHLESLLDPRRGIF